MIGCKDVLGSRNDPAVKAPAVFGPGAVPAVIPRARAAARVSPTYHTRASVDVERLVAAWTCDPGLLFIGRAFRNMGLLISPPDLAAWAS